ncbi:helix-turn-helix domain-containing protein [Lysinibacillus sp. Ag94]|uniref:helix-turn-helix domain-containing protein n=1 Tax=Lysinibacillus sp. Ag94 TaxID=2936682 RepID=UPI00200EF98A|nr:helix-turn-helix domain-containing protein [Lysinibacillus sp. Ag94]UPW81537.1 helix-turn-helix transcriptional regulator [Lysinibacillus sp. Ag94]
MNLIISKRLKELRRIKGLSQKELAKDICTQAVISNIEKGGVIPSSITLFKIAKRLNVDINYFFDNTVTHEGKNQNNLEEIKQLIRSLIRKKDYISVKYITENELSKNDVKTEEDLQFFHWHRAICEYYINSKPEESLNILYSICDFDSIIERDEITNQELGILNSTAIIYFEIKDFEKSLKIYEACINKIHEPNKHIDNQTKIRFLYGMARTQAALNKIEESILNSRLAIQTCIETESLYLLGELNFLIGKNLVCIDKKNEAYHYLQFSKSIFQLQNRYDYINVIEKLELKLQ